MTKARTFFYPLINHDAVKQFLKETYPEQEVPQYFVKHALEKNLIHEKQIPDHIDRNLFQPENPFKLTDPKRMGVILTEDPDLVIKLKKWWFGDKHLAYARTELEKMIHSDRFHGGTEEEIKGTCFDTSYPVPLLYDGTPIGQKP